MYCDTYNFLEKFVGKRLQAFFCNFSVNAHLLHPHTRILINLALYSRMLSFAGMSVLYNTCFIVTNASFAWLI